MPGRSASGEMPDPKMHPSTLELCLSTSLPAYRPGETVTALLHATTSLPDSVELRELELAFVGVERVDTSLVSAAYRRDVPAINADQRRVQRHVVQARLQAATTGAFTDTNLRRYIIRFTLPPWLPPTFKGTAVRYVYYLDAAIKYTELYAGVAPLDVAVGPPTPPQQDGDAEVASRGRPGVAAARLSIHLWPSRDGGMAGLERELSAAGLGGGGAGQQLRQPDVFPALQPDDLRLKCWEIGGSTEVQDAVSHIAKLTSTPGPSSTRPFSPGGFAASRRDDANADASETSSEIGRGERTLDRSRHGSSVSSHPPQRSSDVERGLGPVAAPHVEASAGGGGGLRSFALRIGDQPLVRVCVHPPLEGGLQPCTTLAGTLDFQVMPTPLPPPLPPPAGEAPAAAANGEAAVRCMQVSVALETEESVEAAWRPAGKAATAGGGAIRCVKDDQVEVTADTACTHFVFTLPQDATPSFSTPLLSLRWVLRFQFTARVGGTRVEQLGWVLPLVVGAPH